MLTLADRYIISIIQPRHFEAISDSYFLSIFIDSPFEFWILVPWRINLWESSFFFWDSFGSRVLFFHSSVYKRQTVNLFFLMPD